MTPKKQITARLYGGVLAGSTIEVYRGTSVVHFGPKGCPLFTYTYAGKDGPMPLYAKREKSHAMRRAVARMVYNKSEDPRIQYHMSKITPFMYAESARPDKHGRGARKRAENHARVPSVVV